MAVASVCLLACNGWSEDVCVGLPVEVERPKGYYSQYLYLPELHRRPSQYMVYHGCTSLPAQTAISNPVNTVAALLCVMKGVKSGLHVVPQGLRGR